MKWLILLLLVGCSTVDVKQDYDPQYNFSNLKNYDWKSGSSSPNSLVDDRLRKAADEKLTKEGYQKKENKDFIVSYEYIPGQIVIAPNSSNVGFGIGSAGTAAGVGFGIGPSTRRENFETIRLNIFDSKTNKLIWQGSASEQLVSSNPEKTTKNFQKTVFAILDKFPPKK